MPPRLIRQISVILTSLFCGLTVTTHAQPSEPGTIDPIKCWSHELAESPAMGIAADSRRVYLGLFGGKVETLSRYGRKLWSADLGGTISSNLLLTGNSLILITSPGDSSGPEKSDAVVRSLSKETGITQWTVSIPRGERHYLHSFNGSLIAVSNNGSIRAIDANGGRVLWKREIKSEFAGDHAVSEGTLVIAGISNQVFKISMSTGEIESVHKHSYPVSSILVTTEGDLMTGDERGNITSEGVATGKPNWRFKTGGQISKLMAVGPDLLAASYDNFVYYLAGNDGDVVWKRRLAGRLVYVVKVFDNYGILSSIEDNGAVLVALNNGRVVGQLTLVGDERLAAQPIYSEGSIYIVTNNASYGYSMSECGANVEGGAAK